MTFMCRTTLVPRRRASEYRDPGNGAVNLADILDRQFDGSGCNVLSQAMQLRGARNRNDPRFQRFSVSSSDERCEIRLTRGEISPGYCYADPDNWSHWMPSHPPLPTASPLRKIPKHRATFPNPDSETGHGETVSVEDPHRQPHAASRNTDAELRLRSATVGRSRQTTDLPDLDLRLSDRRRRPGLLRFRFGPARASRGDGRGPGLFAVQPPQQRDRRGQALRLRAHREMRAVLVRHGGYRDHDPRICPPWRRHSALSTALWRDGNSVFENACGPLHRRRGLCRRHR